MEIWIAIISSSAFTAIVNALIEIYKNRTGAKRNADEGIMFALLYCLQQYGEKLITKGEMTSEEYKQFIQMYKTYKKLNGNGFAEKLKSDVEKLPIK